MARQTRSERRARRAAQAESRAALERAPQRQQQQQPQQQQMRPAAAEPAKAADGRHVPGQGSKRFIGESWAELKKVDWPGQQQLIQGTVVVLIACLITGVYLFLADQVFKRFVQHVLLGG
jgi:preprotein translocase subunit SecE